MSRFFITILCFSFSILLMAQSAPPLKPIIRTNWLKNPGAEEDEWELKKWETNYPKVSAPNRVSRYGKTSLEWEFDCNEKCGLPKGAGNVYFRLESTSDEGENTLDQYQLVDIKELTPYQDKGVVAELSGWLAGADAQRSSCSELTVYLSFLDAKNTLIAEDTLKKNIKSFKTLDEEESFRGRMHKFEPFKMTKNVPATAKFAKVLFLAENKCAGVDATSSSAFYIDVLNLTFYPKKEEEK